jgi:hypothetical protein
MLNILGTGIREHDNFPVSQPGMIVKQGAGITYPGRLLRKIIFFIANRFKRVYLLVRN